MNKEDKFWKTKAYLFRVREAKRKAELLERRIEMREEAEVNTDELRMQLAEAKRDAKAVTIAVTDMIGRLADVNQQMVITKRYLDSMDWEKIASDMDMTVRGVQKLHGRALPLLQEMIEDEEHWSEGKEVKS